MPIKLVLKFEDNWTRYSNVRVWTTSTIPTDRRCQLFNVHFCPAVACILYISGPATWCQKFPLAAGQYQSPIDIRTDAAMFDNRLRANPLHISYCTERDLSILNNGCTLMAKAEADSGKYLLTISVYFFT